MKIIYAEFEKLEPVQLESIFKLRQQVFIIEQNCFYEDIDGQDSKAHHLLIYDEKVLAAYLRIFEPGIKFENQASLGRIVVHPTYRGKGIGAKLIKKGIRICNGASIRIEAQAHLKNYYRQFGFIEEGEVYKVDGINHLQMILQ